MCYYIQVSACQVKPELPCLYLSPRWWRVGVTVPSLVFLLSPSGARQTNYGTRIDYVLLDGTLSETLVEADIHPTYMGSDHCPVSQRGIVVNLLGPTSLCQGNGWLSGVRCATSLNWYSCKVGVSQPKPFVYSLQITRWDLDSYPLDGAFIIYTVLIQSHLSKLGWKVC